MQSLAAARALLLIVSCSYPLSALLLALARRAGQSVPAWAIWTWLGTGATGIALSLLLAPGRPWAWAGILAALAPWMAWSAVADGRHGAWVMVAVDAAGLFAIGYGLALAAPAALLGRVAAS